MKVRYREKQTFRILLPNNRHVTSALPPKPDIKLILLKRAACDPLLPFDADLLDLGVNGSFWVLVGPVSARICY